MNEVRNEARVAGPAIKGFMYQFDATILRIIGAGEEQRVVVEGQEDIDIDSDTASESVQCKYLESQRYTPSRLRDPIIPMLRAFSEGRIRDYKIYAHFKEGVPPPCLTVGELKSILTENKRSPIPRRIKHYEQYPSHVLQEFADRLTLHAGPSYDEQVKDVIEGLSRAMRCSIEDAADLYRPNAQALVISLAIRGAQKDRRISKRDFLHDIDQKKSLYTRWRRQVLGEKRFIEEVTREARKSRAFGAAKYRCAVLPSAGTSGSSEFSALTRAIKQLAESTFDSKALNNTKPWTILVDCPDRELKNVKTQLVVDGIIFNDGYEHLRFNPATFSVDPVINTDGQGRKVKRASYSIRILGLSTYRANRSKLKMFTSVVSFLPQAPAELGIADTIYAFHLPHHRADVIDRFLAGVQ